MKQTGVPDNRVNDLHFSLILLTRSFIGRSGHNRQGRALGLLPGVSRFLGTYAKLNGSESWSISGQYY